MEIYVFAYNIKIKRYLDNKEGQDFSVVIFQEKSFTRQITSGTKKLGQVTSNIRKTQQFLKLCGLQRGSTQCNYLALIQWLIDKKAAIYFIVKSSK